MKRYTRIRAVLAAALALAPATGGFTVAELAARVSAITGNSAYTIRQAAYDLRKLRGKNLIIKSGRTRRYQVSPDAVRTMVALLTLRDRVIAPILAGVRSPRRGRPPAHRTRVDRDYQTSGSACKPSSVTWASKRSQQPHRQHLVDQRTQAASAAARCG